MGVEQATLHNEGKDNMRFSNRKHTLMRRRRSVNLRFTLNTSSLPMTRLSGDLFRILYLAHARLCSVRMRSSSAKFSRSANSLYFNSGSAGQHLRSEYWLVARGICAYGAGLPKHAGSWAYENGRFIETAQHRFSASRWGQALFTCPMLHSEPVLNCSRTAAWNVVLQTSSTGLESKLALSVQPPRP